MDVAANIVVKGLVQGVGFRYFVHVHAAQLGLKGVVKNLFSGEVAIEVEGDRSLIEEFITKVKVGPRHSHVTDVSIEWAEPKHRFDGFMIQ